MYSILLVRTYVQYGILYYMELVPFSVRFTYVYLTHPEHEKTILKL